MTVSIKRTTWNNLAGGEKKMLRLKKWLKISVWWTFSPKVQENGFYGDSYLSRVQVIVPLRRFKLGRRSSYLRVTVSR